MLLKARDKSGSLIGASRAHSGVDYYCCECGGTVRRRSGRERRAHFFHLAGSRACRQAGKGAAHWAAQDRIRKNIGDGAELERRFSKIDRIADVAWEMERIVFEVQVSPITAEEVAGRNRDYASVGWTVVWVLHDSRYNGCKITNAEEALAEQLYYYTDIDENGVGTIYHQWVWWQNKRERIVSPRALPDLASPLWGEDGSLYGFVDDLVDGEARDDQLRREMAKLRRRLRQGQIGRWLKGLRYRLRLSYRTIIGLWLESACR